ncbi:hypothetical protein Pan44_37490 [Caulifigura coniformis]|uniref:Uncharacterized protein n=1 Tax=Caulifigura coniformis TaxID=2527983 RepID=A0A517SHV2_9PLAN|nr:hypothetical protein Pan44_37490 [Caulifigura coniformis]
MKHEDELLLTAIEDAIRGGLKSRADLAMSAGLTIPRFNRIASAGVAAGRLRILAERDRFKGLQFELGAPVVG